MISAELQKAIDNLSIQDVYVREQIANCFDAFEPKYEPDIERLEVQHMHLVEQANVVEFDDESRLLRVLVRLGARWVDPGEGDEALSVKALIEVEFTAEYQMSEPLEEASIDEFCLKNVSYHVWPYWRELLSSQCARMHLPRLILPTVQFAQNRHQKREGSEPGGDIERA